MNTTTGIRLEVPQSLYERLQAEQEKRRFKTGKKPALALIIMEYCLEKLDENENDVQKCIHPSEQSDLETNKIDSNTEKRLRRWEEQLFMKQKLSQEKEIRLNEREKEILQEKNNLLEIKSKLLDEREKFQQKTFEGMESMIEQKLIQNELKYKDEKIQRLENELSIAKGRSPRNH
ncbi:MAG: hypothetical protein HY951_03330 [Bacteroidia bacterium]|nr:hypothetical protein [Bacteroidia bacterium]